MNSHSPLQIQAYNHLKNMILSGELEQDVYYSETKISKEIGISRTPMREAIQCLSQDGYITVVPSKGFIIRKLNGFDMKNTIEIRCAIEGFCIHQIVTDYDTDKVQKLLNVLDKLLNKQGKILAEKTTDKRREHFMEVDHQFHMEIVRYADNPEFDQIFQRIMHLIQLTTNEALSVPGRIEETLNEHKKIYENICLRNGDEAYRLLCEHLKAPLSMNIVE